MEPAMKMITAVVNRKDTNKVCGELNRQGVEFTRLATTGGFLRTGNTTLLIGVADEKLDEVIGIIRRNCAQRMEAVPTALPTDVHSHIYTTYPAEVLVGGAIVFVSEITHFEKM